MPTTDPNSFDASYATTGAGLGATVGPEGALIGAGLGLTLGAIKYLLGGQQRKAANAIHPYDPGYEINQEVVDNARITGEQYSDYQLPGYKNILGNIKSSGESAFVNAERGATSSADVLDAANKGNQVQQQEVNQLGVQTAEGKQSALTAYLAAKAAAGAEYQDKNAYERERFAEQMQLKNQLQNNATQNQYGAADQTAKLISAIFASRGSKTGSNTNQGNANPLGSIFGSKINQDNAPDQSSEDLDHQIFGNPGFLTGTVDE